MIINTLKTENFEGASDVVSFNRDIVFMRGSRTAPILHAIGIVTGNRTLTRLGNAACVPWNPGAFIEAEVRLGEDTYTVTAEADPDKEGEYTYGVTCGRTRNKNQERADDALEAGYFRTVHRSAEEESAGILYKCGRASRKFEQYLNADMFWPRNTFGKATEGIGLTETFRSRLRQYMADYDMRPVSSDENRLVEIRRNGTFQIVSSEGDEGNFRPDEDDRTALSVTSFLAVNEFWNIIDDLRDIHHVKWPLFICGLRAPDAARGMVKETIRRSGRQVFVADQGFREPDSEQ